MNKDIVCTRCGANDVIKAGFGKKSLGINPNPKEYYNGVRIQRYQCQRCGYVFSPKDGLKTGGK